MVVEIFHIPAKQHLIRVKVATMLVDQIMVIEVVETIEKEVARSNCLGLEYLNLLKALLGEYCKSLFGL